MNTDKSIRLGEILIQKGWITSEVLEAALKDRDRSGKFLGSVLIEKRRISEDQLVNALSEQLRIPALRIQGLSIDWEMVMRFPASLISDHNCFPIQRDSDSVTFAITNPLDAWALGDTEMAAKGNAVRYRLITQSEMKKLLGQYQKCVEARIRQSLDKK